jgi:glucose/arabinose dehydrogenase
MSKKWLLLIISVIILTIIWQIGFFDNLLDETINAPDTDSGVDEEKPDINEPDNSETTIPVEEIVSIEQLEYEVEIIGEGFNIPWEIVPLPDGRFLITQRGGEIVLLNEGEIYNLHDVNHIGEGGLLGLTLSFEFNENNHLFLYYTYQENGELYNRVSRFTFEDSTLKDEVYIIEGIPGSRYHNGGRIKFGTDEKLYITTGDASNRSLSQDIDSLAGKILRINPDGTIPEDNPFENSPVYAYGFRNPQGLAWHPETNQLFASDHGPDRHDEINLVIAGENYGWPNITCSESSSDYQSPIACYTEFTLAPSGIDFLVMENLIEAPLFVAGLRGNMIMRIDLDGDGNFVREQALFRDYGRIRNVKYYQGSLYVLTNNRDGRGTLGESDDLIIKITPKIEAENK